MISIIRSWLFKNPKNESKDRKVFDRKEYEKLPGTLEELDPSYRALIRELAKR